MTYLRVAGHVASCYKAVQMTGRQLKNFRETLGLSQAAFAKKLGVSRWTIIRSEKSSPSREVELLIDKALREGTLEIKKI
jgi:DNA-binding XRE family transcriptional regulator